MPATPTKPKRKPRTPRPSTDSAESAASPQGEPGELEVAEDPVTAKARKHAISLLHHAIGQLNAAYEASQRAFRVEAIAGGWQMMTLPAFGPLLARLRGERQQSRLSQAAMETLAIVAYRQPILRADLESIRGVACGEVLKSLMDRRLVRIVGRAEEVGRPMLYGTTKEFLRIFGIANLGDLPAGRDAKG
ncbi:MAG: SMC-Scp complex subunit ScpB [Phycisphaerales bacterium]